MAAMKGFDRLSVQWPCGQTLEGVAECLGRMQVPVKVEVEYVPSAFIHLRDGYSKKHILESKHLKVGAAGACSR